MSTYAEKAGKKEKMLAILKELETEGDIKNSFIETLKTAAVGLVGAGAGAAIGRPSLLVGLGTIVAGHYFNSSRALCFGAGMIASGGYKMATGIQGTEVGGLEGMKERVKAFGSDIKDRLYLDKVIKPKAKPNTTEGIDGPGEVQYFKYPNNEINMGSLEAIEDEIAKSSERFEQRQFAGEEDVAGVEERIY